MKDGRASGFELTPVSFAVETADGNADQTPTNGEGILHDEGTPLDTRRVNLSRGRTPRIYRTANRAAAPRVVTKASLHSAFALDTTVCTITLACPEPANNIRG